MPVDEPGEIITSGPHGMKEYFRKPEATAARIREAGFIPVVGKRDSDGYFIHLGRHDDMIITSGLNVYPAEVENLIYSFQTCKRLFVFAIPDPKRGPGDRYCCGASARPCDRPKGVAHFSARQSGKFKVPQTMAIRESLPRTSSGKSFVPGHIAVELSW